MLRWEARELRAAIAGALLTASLLASCGRDPALQPETLRARTVAEQPSAEQVAPAHARADARHRWFQAQWFGAVARWSWVTTVRYAAAYDQSSRGQERAEHRAARVAPAASKRTGAPASGAWAALAACESSGNWSETKGSFEGGLQFSNATWLAYGGGQYAQHAYNASPAEQIAVAERVLASQGPSAWPVCSYRAGMR
jgi:hypothetical protein